MNPEKPTPPHYVLPDGSNFIDLVRKVFTETEWQAILRFEVLTYAFRCGKKGAVEDALKDLDKITDYARIWSEFIAVDKTTQPRSPNPNWRTDYDYAGDFHEGLALVEKYGKWGFVNQEGTVVIALEYAYAGDFIEGLARVKKNEKYGYVNKEGTVKWDVE